MASRKCSRASGMSAIVRVRWRLIFSAIGKMAREYSQRLMSLRCVWKNSTLSGISIILYWRSFSDVMRIISAPVSGSCITKSPNPKLSVMASPRSTGNFLEFLSRKVVWRASALVELAVSDDSMMMGRYWSCPLRYSASLSPASGSLAPSRMNDTSDITPSILSPNFSYRPTASS
ncbi:hypothetical protein IMSAGC006_01438 [Muribaculaceae bacterium]|nr:hypothetical protein IMSAGC006_01438 [Muribaculaceae bacterium]